MKPIIAIVGRPNVGKSTLFNQLTRTRDAIVGDLPGVTRDRHYGTVVWDGIEFTVVDTGGFSDDPGDGFARLIRQQVQQAIADADAIIHLLDGRGGISPFDREILTLFQKYQKPVFHAVNKIDGYEQEILLSDFYSLGIEPLFPISAAHRYGLSDFLDALIRSFPQADEDANPALVRVAVVGRPNVGKSSLINRILGRERVLVSNIPGTTRDPIDTIYEKNGTAYCLIDTAGIRRKGRVSEKLEKFSIVRALRRLDRCHVALIVMDAQEGITDQDVGIAGYAHDRGCGSLVLLNKWDAVEKDDRTAKRYYDQVRESAKFLSYAPVMTISALTGKRVTHIFRMIDEIYDQYSRRIGTGELNRILNQAVVKNEPALHRGKRIKFYYATQASAKPPSFVCFVNYPDAVHFSYQRYLMNQLRDATGLNKTPIKIIFRQRTGKIDFGQRKQAKRGLKDKGKKKRKNRRS